MKRESAGTAGVSPAVIGVAENSSDVLRGTHSQHVARETRALHGKDYRLLKVVTHPPRPTSSPASAEIFANRLASQ